MKKLVLTLIVIVCLSGCMVGVTSCTPMLERGENTSSPAEDIISSVRTINSATAPINPYSYLIEIVLGLAATVATGYAVKKSRDVKVVTKERNDERDLVYHLMVDDNGIDPLKVQEAITAIKTKT